MKKYVFNKEEKEKILKAFNLALDDMYELWKSSEMERIEVQLPLDMNIELGFGGGYLAINSKTIWIYNSLTESEICLEKKNLTGQSKRTNDINLAFQLTKNYEEIRKRLEKRIKSNLSQKEKGLDAVDEIMKKYSPSIDVELDFPKTQNAQTIEVIEEEDGKKIGVINFGERSIRIITNGNLTIINNSDKPKTKLK